MPASTCFIFIFILGESRGSGKNCSLGLVCFLLAIVGL